MTTFPPRKMKEGLRILVGTGEKTEQYSTNTALGLGTLNHSTREHPPRTEGRFSYLSVPQANVENEGMH